MRSAKSKHAKSLSNCRLEMTIPKSPSSAHTHTSLLLIRASLPSPNVTLRGQPSPAEDDHRRVSAWSFVLGPAAAYACS